MHGCRKAFFPDSQKLLQHPNFWIADTAASIYVTSHKIELKNIRKMKQEVSLGDKSAIVANEMGDISAQMCDRYENIISKAKLTDVAMIQSEYKLVSCSKT